VKTGGRSSLFTLDEILSETHGTLAAGAGTGVYVGSVAIDSRTAVEGALFVALPGEKTDGHAHVGDAAGHGSRVLLVSDAKAAAMGEELRGLAQSKGVCAVAVTDTLEALQALARFHMRRLPPMTRIGITGSNGKTTTKEIIGAILSIDAPTAVNVGNLNSEIGLPLACFAVSSRHHYAVFEMGMNRRGEMDVLADIARPDFALVTNIGTAHIGLLGSKADIAEEKKKIFSRFNGAQVGFLPEEEPFAPMLSAGVNGKIVFFGPKSTRLQGSESLGLDGTCIHWEGSRIRFPLFGPHNLSNALGAISVARELGIPKNEIKEGLESVKPLFGRSQIIRGPFTVLFDGYNANPDSMEKALCFMEELEWRGKKIAVLGGMRELGAESAEAHRALGRRLVEARLDTVMLFGEEMGDAWRELSPSPLASGSMWTTELSTLASGVRAAVRDGDLVLVKGSRGMELERLLPELGLDPSPREACPTGGL
jgi:UDP-N-acetylmuramoyl-tripeptide--D-alanyl-D-alanine ligase